MLTPVAAEQTTMSISIGVVMDPIAHLNYQKDSTLAMLWAAAERGWPLYYMEQQHLFLQQGEAMATMAELQVFRDPQRWFELGQAQVRAIGDLDVVLMRKDPPFDNEYVYSTYILEAAERLGTLVVNRCRSLRDCNEKVFATHFPDCCPPLLVSADRQQLLAFHEQHGEVVFKPLDGMGGTAVFRVGRDDPNLNVILEILTDQYRGTIMAQRYLPEIKGGDKRILMIDGVALPHCLARVPAAGENRGNLAAGGRGTVQPLNSRDLWIAEQVGPVLKERGLLFAGLDVIGDYLTEINVTSPTCIREIETATGTDVGGMLMDTIAEQLQRATPSGGTGPCE